jgi:hypothetical protein
MTRVNLRYWKRLLAVLGLCCICTTFSPAWSAGPAAFEGGLTASQFDGLYSGTSQRVSAIGESCHPGEAVALDVRNGRFRLAWRGNDVFDARILHDGSFYATSGAPVQLEKHMILVPVLQGRIGTAGLVADYGTRMCRYRLEAKLPAPMQRLSERTDSAGTHP